MTFYLCRWYWKIPVLWSCFITAAQLLEQYYATPVSHSLKMKKHFWTCIFILILVTICFHRVWCCSGVSLKNGNTDWANLWQDSDQWIMHCVKLRFVKWLIVCCTNVCAVWTFWENAASCSQLNYVSYILSCPRILPFKEIAWRHL